MIQVSDEMRVTISSPEKQLLSAVLLRAMNDATSQTKLSREYNETLQSSALEWFEDTSIQPFSFRWIAEQLSDSPEHFIDAVKRRIHVAIKTQVRVIPIFRRH